MTRNSSHCYDHCCVIIRPVKIGLPICGGDILLLVGFEATVFTWYAEPSDHDYQAFGATPFAVLGVSSAGMANPIPLPKAARRRGNPNWCRPCAPAPVLPTEFEIRVSELGLTSKTCAQSAQLRIWCERNRNRCYVPEWLLNEWGMPVNPNVAA